MMRKAIATALSIVLAVGLYPGAALAVTSSGSSGASGVSSVTAMQASELEAAFVGELGKAGALTAQAGSSLAFSDSSNAWKHDYSGGYPYWASVTTSYLHDNGGSLERVEYADGKLVVEKVSSDFKSALSKKTIPATTYKPSNLPSGNSCLWGGFFSGSSNNYVVTGQANDSENDDLAVYRITKYSKSWSYLSSAELKGANTTVPFDAGSCDMAELGGKLYVRTCHQMYTSSDGLRHQANVHIVVDEASMKIDSSATEVAYYPSGYVSHSFNQHLAVLSNTVYGLDHGDAYPRAAIVTRMNGGNTNVLSFQGSVGQNATGATTGGFESSKTASTLLSTGVWTYDKSTSSVQQNVWVGVTSKDLSSTSVKYLTSYSSSSTETADNPFLVKVNENRFLVMWGVKNFSSRKHTGTVKYQFIDGSGSKIGGTRSAQAVLSDCQPVVYNGKAVWYAADGGRPSFYSIDVTSGAFSKVELLSSASMSYEGSNYYWYDWRTDGYSHAMPYRNATTCPSTTVTLGGRTLKEGTDYTLSYTIDEANAKGIITAKGIGAYKGSSKSVSFDIIPYQLSSWDIQMPSAKTYTGKALCPNPKVVVNGKTLKKGTNYTVSYSKNVNAGTAKLVVKGKGVFGGSVSGAFSINKKANSLVLKVVKKSHVAKYGKKTTVKSGLAFKVSKNTSKGKVTYKKTKGNAKISVSSTGAITVNKGLEKGAYSITVKATSKATANYKAASKTASVKIVVR